MGWIPRGALGVTIETQYRDNLRQRQQTLAAKERVHARYGLVRVLLVLAMIAIAIGARLDAMPWLIALAAAFLVVAVAHARLLYARDRAASAVAFYERGIARVTHQWIGRGRDGRHLAPAHHLYAEDLDLFGRGSLFEMLATTRTHAGEETLARWLLAPAPADVVRARQEAVRELAGRLDLRERMAVIGDALAIGVQANVLRRWAASPIALRGRAPRIGVAVLVASTLASLGWLLRTGTLESLFLVLVIAQLLVAQFYKKRVRAVIEAVDEPAHDLELLTELLRAIETEPVTAPRLRELQAAVARSGRPASAEIGRLSRLIGWLSMRHNVYLAIPAALLMWATQWSFAIEAWRARVGGHVSGWLEVAGEFEALLALATFAAEHADDAVFPAVAEGAQPAIAATGLRHPTLPASAVGNDVAIGGSAPHLLIVSGSNMSGKSTLLRALGANVVLAQMGAPVRAASFHMTPIHIGAAIRVQDSLVDGRSKFMAEITRMKEVVDLATAHRGAVLFLLDEILGGTNSHDRRIGSEALLVGLVNAGAIGLVTTHDLAIGAIADRPEGRAANVHFEDRFEDGELIFDYVLRPGIVKRSNAIELMRSLGLDV
ncbi:MAG TPA: hypothetical protein VFV78_01050 [Vicinamibacterales bacterium]|nr:hypothetical protein [Vicinamibacterales bacterium]